MVVKLNFQCSKHRKQLFEAPKITKAILHMSFCLAGPLQTPFELKIRKPTSDFEPDAVTLMLHALNWLKSPKTSKYFSEFEGKKSV